MNEIEKLSNWICDIVLNLDNKDQIQKIKNEVISMCKNFPVYK